MTLKMYFRSKEWNCWGHPRHYPLVVSAFQRMDTNFRKQSLRFDCQDLVLLRAVLLLAVPSFRLIGGARTDGERHGRADPYAPGC